jgi:hypothetical protein
MAINAVSLEAADASCTGLALTGWSISKINKTLMHPAGMVSGARALFHPSEDIPDAPIDKMRQDKLT